MSSSTFTSEVTCDRSLPIIAFGGYFPTSDDLSSICTSDCLQSLESLINTQQTSCAQDVIEVSSLDYPVTATADTLMWTYNYTCRRDATSGAFCAPVFDSWADGNASDQSCSDCVLGTFQIQLSNTLGWDDELAANFSSLTQSCQATGYAVTSPPPNYINATQTATATATTSSPTAARSCAATYVVQAGDDCHSISTSQRVSTSEMLYNNNLEAGCTHFPAAGAQLCMPPSCDVYTVQANDTCWSIVDSYTTPEAGKQFTISQLISWNVDISPGCDNLPLLEGSQICVTFPGDNASGNGTVTATAPASTATVAPVPGNVVEGTNTQCGKYYEVRGGDTCASVTQIQGISLADFYFLNPEVNSTSCNNLFLGYSYCVQAVGDISTYAGYGGRPTNPCVGGSTTGAASCYATTYASATDGWTFPAINSTSTTASNYSSIAVTSVSAYPITATPNPTPTPYQSLMVNGCTRFYNVASGDTCFDIAQRWSLSLENQLYAWNPDLGSDCSGLQLGVYICVALGTTSPTATGSTSSGPGSVTATTTSAPPTTTSAAAAPGPTQAGISSDCNKWVMQQDGIYCYDMAANAGISLNCLYQMNPALNGDCSGLWAGYAYCIGTASKVCT
ncbi:hypothetical protein KVR01_005082 [Diaporthe batatas]|uniref:uncharacterized protein n=1 Tax=Diaporthe batatas TaxID=748121 RepID=UPI001D05A19C|nr:uncharacterized protein KVR01_005082 [Diaporthe batatas]KAG8164807.1 hypothetical protein KVR01_005082 [Diaporthe batatas]